MNKDQEKKDILNYASDYGKDLHEKTLMEDARKKEIKKYEKDHERNNSKERTNIYVENLNIDKFDNSNYGNNINPTVQGNLDLNMDWSIESSEPLYNNNGLQLSKSNNIKEEEIKKLKSIIESKDKKIYELDKKLDKLNNKLKNKNKIISNIIKFIKSLKAESISIDTIKLLLIFIEGEDNDDEK